MSILSHFSMSHPARHTTCSFLRLRRTCSRPKPITSPHLLGNIKEKIHFYSEIFGRLADFSHRSSHTSLCRKSRPAARSLSVPSPVPFLPKMTHASPRLHCCNRVSLERMGLCSIDTSSQTRTLSNPSVRSSPRTRRNLHPNIRAGSAFRIDENLARRPYMMILDDPRPLTCSTHV